LVWEFQTNFIEKNTTHFTFNNISSKIVSFMR